MSDGHRTQTLADIAGHVGGVVRGDATLTVTGIATVEDARPGDLTFIGDESYARAWPGSAATAALVQRGVAVADKPDAALIEVDDADLALAAVLEALAPPWPRPAPGIHPTAVVEPTATLHPGVALGPHVYVGHRTVIGADTILHPNVTLLDDVTLGAGCVLFPGVVIRERCTLGDRCILHPNVTIGADGFGYRPAPHGSARRIVKIPQIGTVAIGHDVEIGANSCVDRAKLGATRIGDECKIDNLVQIAHNCVLGRAVIVAGQAAIGGSVTIGADAVIGGAAMIADHRSVGAGAKLAGGAALIGDVPPGEVYAGYPARPTKQYFREIGALRYLPGIVRKRHDK